ncbi:MAG: DNA-processing protein DprA [Deinococcota bacterium]
MMDETQLPALRSTFKLLRTPGLGARKIKQLCDYFGSAERALHADADSLTSLPGFGPSHVKAIGKTHQDTRIDTWIDAELERAARLHVKLICYGQTGYPKSLANIYDPPAVLYVRGNLPDMLQARLDHLRCLAIVGTRDPSNYGLDMSRTLAQELALAGVSVVSGLALGVDGAAHQGVLNAIKQHSDAAPTVAVLGSGVDVTYPYKHNRLAQEIVATGGAIVSEYAIGSKPNARHFPGRNRIINGLSAGTLVVEAGAKSGALITADYALEEGRTVLAIPGRSGDTRAEGSLGLLKQGAVLVTAMQDILDEFSWQHVAQSSTNSATPNLMTPSLATNDVATPNAATSSTAIHSASVSLSEAERALLTIIYDRDAVFLDDLIAASGKSAQELLVTLTMLELQGAISLNAQGRYQALKRP